MATSPGAMERLANAVQLVKAEGGLEGGILLAKFMFEVMRWYEALKAESFTQKMKDEVEELIPLLEPDALQVFVQCIPKQSEEDRKALPRGTQELYDTLRSLPDSPYEDDSYPIATADLPFSILLAKAAMDRSRGLPNIWNTCYVNTTIQLLFHVPGLVDRLRERRQVEPLSDLTKSPTRCIENLLVALADQDSAMIERNFRAYFTSLENLAGSADSWAKFHPQPNDQGHHDLLDYLRQLTSEDDCMLGAVFKDLLCYTSVGKIRCLTCGEEHAEPANSLQAIDIVLRETSSGTPHLRDLISQDMDEFKVSKDARCEVPDCKAVGKLRQWVLRSDQAKQPRACLVWLNRGHQQGQYNDSLVEFEETPFHFSCIRASDQCYHELRAVVHFVPSDALARTGHYYVDVRFAEGWKRYEDLKENLVSFDSVKAATATAFLFIPFPAMPLARQPPMDGSETQDPGASAIDAYVNQYLVLDPRAAARLLPQVADGSHGDAENRLITKSYLTLPTGVIRPIHLTTDLDSLQQKTGEVARSTYSHALAKCGDGELQGHAREEFEQHVIERMKQPDFISSCVDTAMSQALSLNVLALDNCRKLISELYVSSRHSSTGSERISGIIGEMDTFILQNNGIVAAQDLDIFCSKVTAQLRSLHHSIA